ncbi:NHL repeat-containing protein 2-like [Dendronephthya gigantea]|uniref:NHL repeat-containing protein 2-like n=1 Tax=Dendronephthya gigantea TaxID=151771 RepID=UPI00106D6683|nr:NHL repeat-containing protein 2-like [Dendronephthya gigantea]
MSSKDQLFLLKLESSVDKKERDALIQQYLKTFGEESGGKIRKVPDFPEGCEWMNLKDDSSLSINGNLRGKICVLDFFTYCCINCMHILPDLHALEAKHSVEDGLVVVGVHSAKFENEKVSKNILNAILRYDITHPVVNDTTAFLWNAMEIACWPTLVVVGPNGQHLLSLVGEGHRETLMEFVDAAIKWFQNSGKISNHSINISLARDSLPQTSLSFPGKISLKKSGDKMAVADTGHHRILIVDMTGVVETVVGKGESGLADGGFDQAQFNCPQGLAWKGDSMVFVADTENHAIRLIDLKSKTVTTVAGTGLQGNDKIGGKIGKEQKISSPWDVVIGPSPGSLNILEDESVLYIAMAGTHQIWGLCLADTKWLKRSDEKAWSCLRFSGSGAEENRNNSYPHKTGFAQPSGLTVARAKPLESLFIADSESSSVRSVAITTGGAKALVGADRDPMNLFAFGDLDGSGVDAKLQHPLAVSWNDQNQLLYVADSYNHKIKVVDPIKKTCTTILGTGEPGCEDGDVGRVQFNEPGGMDVSPDGSTLYVADTNSHAIRMVDLKTTSVSTLPIISQIPVEKDGVTDITDSSPRAVSKYRRLAPRNASTITCNPVETCKESLEILFSFSLPEHCQLTEGVESRWQCAIFDDSANIGQTVHSGQLINPDVPITILIDLSSNKDIQITVEGKIYYCEPNGACFMQGVLFELPVKHQERKGPNDTKLPVKIHYDCTKP